MITALATFGVGGGNVIIGLFTYDWFLRVRYFR